MKIARLRRILERVLYRELKKAGRPHLRRSIKIVRTQIRRYPGQPSPKGGPPARRSGRYSRALKIKTKFKAVRTKEGYYFHKSGIHRSGSISTITYLKIQQSPVQKILGTPTSKYERYRPLRWPMIDQKQIARQAVRKAFPEARKAMLKAMTEAVNWPTKPILIKLTTGK